MKKSIMIIAPVAMLALAACNKSETANETGTEDAAATAAASAEPVAMPPSITAKGTYRCADNTVIYVDFFGDNEAADIRVGEDSADAVRVKPQATEAPSEAPEAGDAAAGEAKPAGPMKSEDGETMLTGTGDQINVKLPGKGAQSCKK